MEAPKAFAPAKVRSFDCLAVFLPSRSDLPGGVLSNFEIADLLIDGKVRATLDKVTQTHPGAYTGFVYDGTGQATQLLVVQSSFHRLRRKMVRLPFFAAIRN